MTVTFTAPTHPNQFGTFTRTENTVWNGDFDLIMQKLDTVLRVIYPNWQHNVYDSYNAHHNGWYYVYQNRIGGNIAVRRLVKQITSYNDITYIPYLVGVEIQAQNTPVVPEGDYRIFDTKYYFNSNGVFNLTNVVRRIQVLVTRWEAWSIYFNQQRIELEERRREADRIRVLEDERRNTLVRTMRDRCFQTYLMNPNTERFDYDFNRNIAIVTLRLNESELTKVGNSLRIVRECVPCATRTS
jgi:hypothetical protein